MARVETKLTPTKDGGFTARKRIPADVREEYGRQFGKGEPQWEAWFNSGPVPIGLARAKHREWLSDIEARIANIRAERKGDGRTLSPMQARALAGEWYLWWTARELAKPPTLKHWQDFYDHLCDRSYNGAVAVTGVLDEPPPGWNANTVWEQDYEAREDARAMAADWAETSQFLHAKRLILDPFARELFLDHVCRDLFAALDLLIRRAKGDYSEDTHPKEFPKLERTADPSLTPWALFERWVAEVKPAVATVDRWRGVFLKLKYDFPAHSASTLTPEESQDWLRGLITPERSAGTVRDIWTAAGRTVFRWAVEQRLVPRNPFTDVRITVPRRNTVRETKAFTDGEIKTILRAASGITPGTPTEAARRWVPWLCAYTGARVGEITQLRGIDVITQDGTPAIRITPDAGTQKVRKARTVPLHPHLVEQGFLSFAASAGQGPMFYNAPPPKGAPDKPEPTNPRKPRFVKAREHLAQWVRDLGISDPDVLPNHAWRHTFKQIGHRNDISERILDAIVGHTPLNVGRGYGTPTLSDMATALHKFPQYDLKDT
jgi:integrase